MEGEQRTAMEGEHRIAMEGEQRTAVEGEHRTAMEVLTAISTNWIELDSVPFCSVK